MNMKAFAPAITVVTDAMKQDFEVHTLREFAATLNGITCNVRLTFYEFASDTPYVVAGVDDSGKQFVKSHSNLPDAEADYHHQSFPLMITASMMLGEMARQMEELSNVIDSRADVINAAHAAEQGE